MTLQNTNIKLALRIAWQDKVGHGLIWDGIPRLNRYSRTLHRLAEKDCNVGLSERDRKLEARTLAKAQAVARDLGVSLEHKTDPRAGCGLVVTVDGQEFRMANARGR